MQGAFIAASRAARCTNLIRRAHKKAIVKLCLELVVSEFHLPSFWPCVHGLVMWCRERVQQQHRLPSPANQPLPCCPSFTLVSCTGSRTLACMHTRVCVCVCVCVCCACARASAKYWVHSWCHTSISITICLLGSIRPAMINFRAHRQPGIVRSKDMHTHTHTHTHTSRDHIVLLYLNTFANERHLVGSWA